MKLCEIGVSLREEGKRGAVVVRIGGFLVRSAGGRRESVAVIMVIGSRSCGVGRSGTGTRRLRCRRLLLLRQVSPP